MACKLLQKGGAVQSIVRKTIACRERSGLTSGVLDVERVGVWCESGVVQ